MDGTSIVICCHNSSARLPATLNHLARQVPSEIGWEIIVVDNASTDDTSEVARQSWPGDAPATLRVVSEPQLGLTFARYRGFSEAKYEIVSFIDDDNWVCSNWVQLVSEIMSRHLNVGACGGYIEAVCEVPPPWWFDLFKRHYAIGPQGEEAGDVTFTRSYLWGAGLSIRKSAWQQLVSEGFRPLLADRQGDAPTAGGDSELCLALRLAGWRLWYEPRLQLRHFLPAARLNWRYMRRLHRGFGASYVWLDLYKSALMGKPDTAMGRLKQTQLWKILAILRSLLTAEAKLLFSFSPITEGKSEVLRVESCIGQLLELAREHKSLELTFKKR